MYFTDTEEIFTIYRCRIQSNQNSLLRLTLLQRENDPENSTMYLFYTVSHVFSTYHLAGGRRHEGAALYDN